MAVRWARALIIGLVGLTLACKATGNGPTVPCGFGNPCSGTLASLTLSPPFDTLLVGDQAQIVVTASDAAGNPVTNVHSTFSSSNPHVATVDTTGLVRADSVGTTTLTVSAGGKKASAQLTVLAAAVVQLAASIDYSCALLPLGRGFCWGVDGAGQLGNSAPTACFDSGGTGTQAPCALSPIAVSGGLRFVTVAAGGAETCALSVTATAYCWGLNTLGQLGNGTVGSVTTPTPVAGLLQFTSITVGALHACGVATGSRAFCWGSDANGQLGDTGIVNSTTPIPVVGGGPFVALTAGGSHTCGLTAAGVAQCWGSNAAGQLGTGTAGDHSTPVAVAGGLTFTALSAGAVHTCGITSSGAAFCWGAFGSGASGVPTAVPGGLTFTQISSGAGFTCGLSGTAVFCWGVNPDGQLGDGATSGPVTAPVQVVGGFSFVRVSAGARHACAIISDGRAACWGSNLFGALGNSLQAAVRGTPVIVGTPLS